MNAKPKPTLITKLNGFTNKRHLRNYLAFEKLTSFMFGLNFFYYVK